MAISTHTLTWSVTQNEYIMIMYSKHFNSHAHVERDDPITITVDMGENFNSHAHVERDSPAATGTSSTKNFNSHAHVERDEQGRNLWDEVWDFNSHAHVERDVERHERNKRHDTFQLTRSRGA